LVKISSRGLALFSSFKKYLIILIMLGAVASVFAGSTKISKTKLIYFKPTVTPAEEKIGFCWMNSAILNRSDAWRCMVKDSIHDPCFLIGASGRVVCEVDPNKNQDGFALKLFKPLAPSGTSLKETPDSKEGDFWLIKLADGRVCSPYSGTRPIIKVKDKGELLKYNCENSSNGKSGLVAIDGTKKLWQAIEVNYIDTQDRVKITESKVVKLQTVWQ